MIDGTVREGARRMLTEAPQAEVDAYIALFSAERDERGRRLVVRNGSHQPRDVLTTAGAVEVTVSRVNDKRIDPDTRGAGAVLLGDPAALVQEDSKDQRGVATAVPARPVHQRLRAGAGPVPGSSAGLSAPVITRMTETSSATVNVTRRIQRHCLKIRRPN